jgi:hypothetical protein
MRAEQKQAGVIRIEIGNTYRTRAGKKVGPIEKNPLAHQFHYKGMVEGECERAYDLFGTCHREAPTDWDIVAEWIEPEIDPAAETAKLLANAAAMARPSERATIGRYLETVAQADQPASEYKPSTAHCWDDLAEPGYERLARVLQEAHDHAAKTKGKERHANGKSFDQQPIMVIPRSQGTPAGQIYQIQKKAGEALGMFSRAKDEAAIAELLGVINYAAAAILHIRETH